MSFVLLISCPGWRRIVQIPSDNSPDKLFRFSMLAMFLKTTITTELVVTGLFELNLVKQKIWVLRVLDLFFPPNISPGGLLILLNFAHHVHPTSTTAWTKFTFLPKLLTSWVLVVGTRFIFSMSFYYWCIVWWWFLHVPTWFYQSQLYAGMFCHVLSFHFLKPDLQTYWMV